MVNILTIQLFKTDLAIESHLSVSVTCMKMVVFPGTLVSANINFYSTNNGEEESDAKAINE